MQARELALELLLIQDPQEKALRTRALHLASLRPDAPAWDTQQQLASPPGLPGRPLRPQLVSPKHVPARSVHTLAGRAAMVHAVVHIEFNAINLALDAVWRFAGMPLDFYRQWLQVAAEEAYHFELLNEHLGHLGHQYGDFAAHDGLWQLCERTQEDLLARMAMVPRLMEARGLDATPLIQEKFRTVGDQRTIEILDIILRDEVGHVAIGNHWYRWLCAQQNLDPQTHERTLFELYQPPKPRGPFNLAARRAAGFSEQELAELQARG